MRHRPILPLLLLLLPTAAAQAPPADSPVAQAMLAEIRQLRTDLQATAATIQRVQIVVYRLHFESVVLDRAAQRAQQAHGACNDAEAQQKPLAAQIEQAETQRRTEHAANREAFEAMLAGLKSAVEAANSESQECRVELVEAESQLRTEQGKMNDLEEQLDKLDRMLAGSGSK